MIDFFAFDRKSCTIIIQRRYYFNTTLDSTDHVLIYYIMIDCREYNMFSQPLYSVGDLQLYPVGSLRNESMKNKHPPTIWDG